MATQKMRSEWALLCANWRREVSNFGIVHKSVFEVVRLTNLSIV